jgi:hypothetical protein
MTMSISLLRSTYVQSSPEISTCGGGGPRPLTGDVTAGKNLSDTQIQAGWFLAQPESEGGGGAGVRPEPFNPRGEGTTVDPIEIKGIKTREKNHLNPLDMRSTGARGPGHHPNTTSSPWSSPW